jgi:hypothetical protein
MEDKEEIIPGAEYPAKVALPPEISCVRIIFMQMYDSIN